jgi:hypothetical protein
MFGPIPVVGRPLFFFSVPAIALPLKRWYRIITEPEQGWHLAPALTPSRLSRKEAKDGWRL